VPIQYVILWHDGIAEPHFDLMFETLPGSALSTWRSLYWPIESATPALRLKDHRRAYLDFEGDLSDRRGRVTRVAAGACEVHVGEGGVWRITLLTGSPLCRLIVRQVHAEAWEIAPDSPDSRSGA
jgi:hypothetical protein